MIRQYKEYNRPAIRGSKWHIKHQREKFNLPPLRVVANWYLEPTIGWKRSSR